MQKGRSEAQPLAQSLPLSKWQSQDSNQLGLTTEHVLLTWMLPADGEPGSHQVCWGEGQEARQARTETLTEP